MLAQHLSDRQHQIGRRRALGQLAGEAHADHLRQEHADRLPEHGGFGLDPADAPAQAAESVDHRGVRIGADQGVGIRLAVRGHDHAREKFEVDLMDDAGVGRHALEVVERLLSPLEEPVALAVAGKFEVGVLPERVPVAERIDLH